MTSTFYPSAEIRWFWPQQDLWCKLLTWFTRQGQLNVVAETTAYVRQPDTASFVKQERPRTDEYLLLPNCEVVGFKQCQGRLEVKAPVVGPRWCLRDLGAIGNAAALRGSVRSRGLGFPHAANAFNIGTIADVLVNIEYTALDGSTTFR